MSILDILAERGLTEQSYLDVSLLEVVTGQVILLLLLIRRVRNQQSNPSSSGTEISQKVCANKMYSLTSPMMF